MIYNPTHDAVRLQINQSVQFRVLTPVLFLLVSSKETVKVAAKLGELSTSLRASRHSPRNLKETHTRDKEMDLKHNCVIYKITSLKTQLELIPSTFSLEVSL